jgi:hypothetical protein
MEESSAALPTGWVPLGASSWWQRITAITVIPSAVQEFLNATQQIIVDTPCRRGPARGVAPHLLSCAGAVQRSPELRHGLSPIC